jgi:hypothetical protein
MPCSQVALGSFLKMRCKQLKFYDGARGPNHWQAAGVPYGSKAKPRYCLRPSSTS